jgi:hypothetical protein
VHRGKRPQKHQRPSPGYNCCGRIWLTYHVFPEFPVRDGANEEPFGIEWIKEFEGNEKPGRVLYNSTLSRVWLPQNGIDFLGEFLKELSSHWQRVCAGVDDSMILHVRLLFYRDGSCSLPAATKGPLSQLVEIGVIQQA